MTEKHFCLQTFFCHEIFQILVLFFYVKTATPLKKVVPCLFFYSLFNVDLQYLQY